MLKGSSDMKLKTKKKVKKKDKPKKKFVGKGLKIVDEDTFSFDYKPPSDSDGEDVEDLPQIAAVVDERPVEVQVLETFSQSKWKRLQDDEEEEPAAGSAKRYLENRDSDDASPPRQRLKDLSPKRRKRRDSDDLSPPRARVRRGSGDISPVRQRGRRDSSDISPPRERRRRDSSDISPPRHGRRNDVSPPRRGRRSSDTSPPRRGRRSSDTSPPRRGRRSSDTSPPRRGRNGSSPPRRKRRNSSSDTSPPRRRKVTSPGPSDRRGRERTRNLARPEILDTSDDDSDGKRKTTLDGKKAGLQKAAALRDEMLDFRKRENQLFETLPDEVSGRHAKAVIRDRRTEADIAKEQEKQRLEEERKQQYSKWGKGLKQVEEQAERVRSALHEMAKPLARSKDDEDLEDHLRSIDRDGDPMLEYLQAKRRKASGVPEKPKYNGPQPPPNRFNIPPGYRWDGVDRSNGYEREWFNHINAKKALQEEAHKWSVEDL